MKKTLRAGIAAVALLTASSMAHVATAADYVLKYGHPGPVGPDSDDHVAGEFLKFFLESRSNGRMEVQIFP
ncbi:MAG: hypothetical protein KDH19_01040, partial [Geminicoccaceae bacterium]|nr:hypothetical protein [Geminicoccaceae bacterium]